MCITHICAHTFHSKCGCLCAPICSALLCHSCKLSTSGWELSKKGRLKKKSVWNTSRPYTLQPTPLTLRPSRLSTTYTNAHTGFWKSPLLLWSEQNVFFFFKKHKGCFVSIKLNKKKTSKTVWTFFFFHSQQKEVLKSEELAATVEKHRRGKSNTQWWRYM